MFDTNIRSLLSVSAHVESSLPSRTFIPASILINFSCLLADLRSMTSHVLRQWTQWKNDESAYSFFAIMERTMVSLVWKFKSLKREFPTILIFFFFSHQIKIYIFSNDKCKLWSI